MYYFYMLRCRDNSLYCGKTTDLQKRLDQHNAGKSKSAKYTKSRLPVKLVYHEEFETLSEALKREAQVKKYTKKQKELLVSGIIKA